jgi:hypothetical protein
MFEQPAGKVEKDRSRSIMILSGVAVLAVIVLIALVSSFGRKSAPVEFAQPGSPEFDSYVQYIKITNFEPTTGERPNLGTKFARIRCAVENTGDKDLIGLQLRMILIGFDEQVIKQKTITPVPEIRRSLGAKQSMNIDVAIEPSPDRSEIMDMKIEVAGLETK